MSDITLTLDVAIPILLLAVLATALVARRVGTSPARLRELQSTLDEALAEREQLREESDAYRKQVADHFAETSERLHDLTLQYRSVYEHLAQGAEDLCPEGFQKLEGGLGLDALPEESFGAPGDSAAPEESPSSETASGRERRP